MRKLGELTRERRLSEALKRVDVFQSEDGRRCCWPPGGGDRRGRSAVLEVDLHQIVDAVAYWGHWPTRRLRW